MTDGRFANRQQAGRLLAEELRKMMLTEPVILALPRGGVPLGYEVAKALKAPLDIIMVRKIGAPGHEEYGIGAVVDGASPQIVIDHDIARMVGAKDAYIQREVETQLAEIERRRAIYRTEPPVPLAGRSVVIVDDGIATGGTVRAALQALTRSGAAQIILAVPVAPASTLRDLAAMCDQTVCLMTPEPFYAVGAHYAEFGQTKDAEVVELLSAAKAWAEPKEN
ncbi:phosphoribosyltransferase [Altererythrobacter sp. ZODW24]|uniref:phosphoribosyltransferase n=1 Tax=Altererythrobacter sp. ZODW24 TaxID=2185142 RepID=UPI000DF7AF5E|nr:phosphoribosyltransferase [Altererythrobacter sp. ZODW24]